MNVPRVGHRARFLRRSVALIAAGVLLGAVHLAGPSGAEASAAPGIPLAPGVKAGSLTLGPDGDFWFAGGQYYTGYEAVVGKLTPTGAVSEYAVPSPPSYSEPRAGLLSRASAITTGADGALWFTASLGFEGVIGRVTTSGEVTEFPLPEGQLPGDLALGPDGNVWFTVEAASAIGRSSPAGTIAEYPLQPGSAPRSITAGPDGALWFTEFGSDRIGRIDPGGLVTEIQLHSGTARPSEITLGHEGDVWFGEAPASEGLGYSPRLADRLGRVSADGRVRLYRVPMRFRGVESMVAGPHGRIWYSTTSGPNSEVGWIAPSGRYGLLTPTVSTATSLAVGPEGRLWFSLADPYNGGGGGSGQLEAMLPGRIAGYEPPAVALSTGAAPVRNGRTSVELECLARTRCEGTLALTGYHDGEPERYGSGHYRLPPRHVSRFPLVLDPLGLTRLAELKRFPVGLEARSAAGRRVASQSVRLVAAGRLPPG